MEHVLFEARNFLTYTHHDKGAAPDQCPACQLSEKINYALGKMT